MKIEPDRAENNKHIDSLNVVSDTFNVLPHVRSEYSDGWFMRMNF